MKTLRLITGDQLSRDISALEDIDPGNDLVFMAEIEDEITSVQHHKQKIVLVLSAMRHFAEALRTEGINVDYIYLEEEGNTGSFSGELLRAIKRHQVEKVIVTEPSEWRVWKMMREFSSTPGIQVEIRTDNRFLCSHDEFSRWASGRKAMRMEHFYRWMRRQTGWLMKDSKPEGGKWNFDAMNRRTLPRNLEIPPRRRVKPDDTTKVVMELIESRFPAHFGDLETFAWAVTREGALEALRDFIERRLYSFGDYQDAMKSGENFIFHSALSPYLNLGLLTPREVCLEVIQAYNQGKAPLHSVEGFLRQIIGWREYIRGFYWMHMPDYQKTNYFAADRPLPSFYWTGETDLNCMREAIETTRRNAYAHHIQRLMITGNFALLAGINPAEVEEWYLIVYADAFEWVELPNTHSMALYADGGLLSSKPYSASGAYINRMSDYCSTCVYNPKTRLGSKACPFNYLYWNFLMVNEELLKNNPRMGLTYRNLNRMDNERRIMIKEQTEDFLARLDSKY